MNAKQTLRRWVFRSAQNPTFHRYCWRPLYRLANLAESVHRYHDVPPDDEWGQAVALVESSHAVTGGPFAGMTYPRLEAYGSALWPKLLGCYEQELHGVVEAAIARKPRLVIDIGSAEGYYATGFARRLPDARVIAYEMEAFGRELCVEMAERNEVDARVEVRGACGRDDLRAAVQPNCLIVCDCEGAEERLLSAEVAAGASVLVETHDFIRPHTTRRLFERFHPTHEVEVIHSIPDALRPVVLPRPLDGRFGDAVLARLMAEGRPDPMHWLWCTPREPNG